MTRPLLLTLCLVHFAAAVPAETVIAPLSDPKARLVFLKADLREARTDRARTHDPLRRMSLTCRIRDLQAEIDKLEAEISGN